MSSSMISPNGSNSHDADRQNALLSSQLPSEKPVAVSSLAKSSETSSVVAEHNMWLDHAYDEYCRLEKEGQLADPDSFCAKYPQVQSSLVRLLQAHRFVVEHSELLPEATEPDWPELDEMYAGFQLVRVLGSGAFSRVYQARDPDLGFRRVTVKLTTRGYEEAAALGTLDHPGIVKAHSAREDDETGLWAISMPYEGSATLHNVLDYLKAQRKKGNTLTGKSILDACADPFADPEKKFDGEALKNRTFSDAVRWLACRLSEALAVLHERGIQHRDIKPSNVLMRPDGTPCLIDFNLSTNERLEPTGIGGTPMYMAPEQIEAILRKEESNKDAQIEASDSSVALDHRIDLYSLGLVLYELASGRHPCGRISLKLPAKPSRKHMLKRQRQGILPLRKACPNLDADLANAIDACLELDPARRPASARDLLKRLTPSWPRRVARTFTRRYEVIVAGIALFATLGAVAAMQFVPATSAELLRSARTAYEKGSYAQAKHLVNQVLQLEPENVDGLMLRGRTYVRLDDLHSANADFNEADRLRPDGIARVWRGYCFQLIRQPDAAKLAYEGARALKVKCSALPNNLGAVYLDKSDLANAEKVLREALKKDAASQALHHNLSQLCLKKGLVADPADKPRWYEEGIRHVEAALRNEPVTTELLFDSAALYALAARSNHAKYARPAIIYLEKAIRAGLDPARLQGNSLFSAVKTEVDELMKSPPPAETVATRAKRILEPSVSN